MGLNRFGQFVLCAVLVVMLGCDSDRGAGGAGRVDGPSSRTASDGPESWSSSLNKEADDFVPRYLPSPAKDEQRSLAAPPLAELGSTQLQVDNHPFPSPISSIAVSAAGFFCLELENQIWHFGPDGKFLKRFGSYPAHNVRIDTGAYLESTDSDGRLYVADDSNGVLVLGQDGSFVEQLSDDIEYAYSLAKAPGGHLLVGIATLRGPHWISLADPTNPSLFYSRRRALLPMDQEFLASSVPHSTASFDSRGNIYIGACAVPQIRKFKTDTSYVGDFRIQKDPLYVAPPDTRPETFGVSGTPLLYSQMNRLCVVKDYVIAGFSHPSPDGGMGSLHFYTLDGQPAFRQFRTEYSLSDCNSDGQLYFSDYSQDDQLVIRAYQLDP